MTAAHLESNGDGGYASLRAEVEFDAEDNVWLSRLTDEPRCHSWGRTHAQAVTHLADAAALWFEVDDPQDISFEVRTLGLPIDHDEVRRARQDAEAAAARAKDLTANTVRVLTDQGYSRRDVASILDISHQRVQQILDRTTAVA